MKDKFRIPDFDDDAGAQTLANQSTVRRLLEETKLSKLKPSFNIPNLKACSVCGSRLEAENDFQQSTKVCRKCINHFAQVSAALDSASLEKTRAAKLEKWRAL